MIHIIPFIKVGQHFQPSKCVYHLLCTKYYYQRHLGRRKGKYCILCHPGMSDIRKRTANGIFFWLLNIILCPIIRRHQEITHFPLPYRFMNYILIVKMSDDILKQLINFHQFLAVLLLSVSTSVAW